MQVREKYAFANPPRFSQSEKLILIYNPTQLKWIGSQIAHKHLNVEKNCKNEIPPALSTPRYFVQLLRVFFFLPTFNWRTEDRIRKNGSIIQWQSDKD